MSRMLRLSVLLLVLGLISGAARVVAQATQGPTILTGTDLGFRVDRQRSDSLGRVTGTWVVRYNGQWVEPDTSGPRPLTTR